MHTYIIWMSLGRSNECIRLYYEKYFRRVVFFQNILLFNLYRYQNPITQKRTVDVIEP